jgi:hypothetical protein
MDLGGDCSSSVYGDAIGPVDLRLCSVAERTLCVTLSVSALAGSYASSVWLDACPGPCFDTQIGKGRTCWPFGPIMLTYKICNALPHEQQTLWTYFSTMV